MKKMFNEDKKDPAPESMKRFLAETFGDRELICVEHGFLYGSVIRAWYWIPSQNALLVKRMGSFTFPGGAYYSNVLEWEILGTPEFKELKEEMPKRRFVIATNSGGKMVYANIRVSIEMRDGDTDWNDAGKNFEEDQIFWKDGKCHIK